MAIKKHLEKLIPLYLYGELSEDEKREFEIHIDYCDQCRTLLQETRELHAKLGQKNTPAPTDEALQNSRLLLRQRLQKEQRRPLRLPLKQRISEFFAAPQLVYQIAGGVALLLLGIFLGRYFTPQTPSMGMQLSSAALQQESAQLISNVDMIQYDPNSQIVTVRYKTINDVSLRGGIDDPAIRTVLAHAIRGEDHPGQRLTAVKASSASRFTNGELENALLYALENDDVDGIRLRAAKVLKSLTLTQNIKRGFIRVLLKEPNPAIRIEALEALAKVVEQDDVVPIFRDASRDDENEFVRLQAAKALQRIEPSK